MTWYQRHDSSLALNENNYGSHIKDKAKRPTRQTIGFICEIGFAWDSIPEKEKNGLTIKLKREIIEADCFKNMVDSRYRTRMLREK
jgi:hypothetical protein